jgi:hypothetical protein
MLNRSGTLQIGISMTSVTVLRDGRGKQAQPEVLAEQTLGAASAAAAAGALDQALQAAREQAPWRRGAAAIVLADEWSRSFMVTPPGNLESMRDCRAALALRFQALYGEEPSDWRILADWDACRPFLACALPHALQQSLHETCASHGLTLVSMAPQLICLLNRWRRQIGADAWFGSVHGGMLTLAAIDGGRLAQIRRAAIPASALLQQAWLKDQAGREALRLGLPLPRRLRLCGAVPAAWLADDDEEFECSRLEAATKLGACAQDSAGAALACSGA